MKKFIVEMEALLGLSKISLKMKLSYILFLFTLFQIQANTYSQNVRVNLDCKEMKIEDVLKEIESKTDFKFLFEKDVFKKNKIVNISSKNEPLSNILKTLFKADKVDFKVVDKQIILINKNNRGASFINSLKSTLNSLVQQDIKGKITSDKGEPLAGATVIVKGTSTGVSSDFDGNFRIAANSTATLIVSYIGFETLEVAVNNRTTVNIQLKEAVTGLDETIIVAYGKVKKEAFTGSVGVVDVQSITNQGNILNVDQALQGQVAGVQVGSPAARPGAAARVRIRGSSSILGTNQPLYVIDGVPITPSTELPGYSGFIDTISNNDATTLENEGFNNDLAFLDFNNIESISILKDASATALYGSRAAGGVIIITTKSGNKATKPQFELSITQRSNMTQKMDVLNTSEYEEIYKESIQNYVNSGGVIPTSDSFALGILNGTEINRNVDTDWQDLAIRRTSQTNNYAFNVRGAGEKGSYYSSLGLLKDDGSFIGDKLNRYTFGLNLKQNLKDNLSFFTNLNLGRTESDYALNGLYSTLEAATFIRPDATPYNPDGSLIPQIGDIYNPISSKERRVTSTNFSSAASIGLEYEPVNNLFIKTMGILQHINAESYSF